ncbi:unnamed protein product, partial [Rotaria sp. Silwood1]
MPMGIEYLDEEKSFHPSSSFVPINNLTSTIQTLPIISSSPAYSDISDEESTTTANEN